MPKDPYRYFRVEARELLEGLAGGVLQLEKSPTPEGIAKLLRFAHTLKGAARVVKQPAIAEHAHALEGMLAPHREGDAPISHEEATRFLQICDQIGAALHALDPSQLAVPAVLQPATSAAERDSGSAAQLAQAAQQKSPDEQFETVRIEIQEMDLLLGNVAEAGVQLRALRREMPSLEKLHELSETLLERLNAEKSGRASPLAAMRTRAIAEELETRLGSLQRTLALDIERMERGLIGIHDVAQRLRLLPAQAIVPSMERAVRDAALTLGKQVVLESSGSEVRLDAGVLAALRDALLHVVRNAVAHGMESEAERVRAGKPAVGKVRLEVERLGARAIFRCKDDGRGIDVDEVRRTLVARKLLTREAAQLLSAEEIFAILLGGGLTTAGNLSELSGRGIGLDVVRATAAQLKGQVRIKNHPGRGMELEIEVPITIASLAGLVVEADGALASLPLDAVRETLRILEKDLLRTGPTESLLYNGKVLPFLPLDVALRRKTPRKAQRAWSVVIVKSGEKLAAIGVDRCLGAESIVARALPAGTPADPVVAGASLNAEGNPQLVLDPAALVAAAERGRRAEEAAPGAGRPPVLIIDDSLTTRMLEQSILESAGYEVELATSAEEGIVKARQRKYGLFLVDVEMPGMDGFEFVARTRADAQLGQTPAILVTSRNAPEDRLRGQEAGAHAYVVKGEFDQGVLLQTIRSLIG